MNLTTCKNRQGTKRSKISLFSHPLVTPILHAIRSFSLLNIVKWKTEKEINRNIAYGVCSPWQRMQKIHLFQSLPRLFCILYLPPPNSFPLALISTRKYDATNPCTFSHRKELLYPSEK